MRLLLLCILFLHGTSASLRTLNKHNKNHKNKHKGKEQETVRKYSILSASDIRTLLWRLHSDYPELTELHNAQSWYGLPAAGNATDCRFDHDERQERNGDRRLYAIPAEGCLNWFLTVHDKMAHPQGSVGNSYIPEVLLSGALHGNERVGPTAVMETGLLLLKAARCEALPRDEPPGEGASEVLMGEWKEQLEEAEECRSDLRKEGVGDDERRWLARLVTTRRVVIVPTANALGYYRNERTEDGVDPNRDFPFDLAEGDESCMETIAARTINEIVRRHLFQLGITFHAGEQSVTYEWGAPSYGSSKSPDDQAQVEIARGYSKFGGSFEKHGGNTYEVGTMTDVVYPVRGGMEDWSYAASWETDKVPVCKPDSYGGYTDYLTKYNPAVLRFFNTLVEAADKKHPPPIRMGSSLDVFDPLSKGNGHIPRNIRLSLMMIDIVEPYVSMRNVDQVVIEDDVVPLRRRVHRSCQKTKTVVVPKSQKDVSIGWIVGGGFVVDKTGLFYAKWSDLPDNFDGESMPDEFVTKVFDKVFAGSKDADHDIHVLEADQSSGRTRWHQSGSDPKPLEKARGLELFPHFSATLNLDAFAANDTIAVFAFAEMDQYWSTQPDGINPSVPPQSHVVNARTNPTWRMSNEGKYVKGRKHWFAIPVSIVISADEEEVVESSARIPVGFVPPETLEHLMKLEGEVRDFSIAFLVNLIIFGFLSSVVIYVVLSKFRYNQIDSGYDEDADEDNGMSMEEFDHTIE